MKLDKLFEGIENRHERTSYKIFLLSATLIFIGLLTGSFIPYTIFIAGLGTCLLLAGMIIFIISQIKD